MLFRSGVPERERSTLNPEAHKIFAVVDVAVVDVIVDVAVVDVAVVDVIVDAAIVDVAHTLAVVSVGVSKSASVCLPLPRTNEVSLLLARELAGSLVITHASLDEVGLAFAVCWCR